MKKHLKSAAALLVCVSGWALVPFTSMPAQVFGWELFAEAYGEIFSDGFETGNSDRWSWLHPDVERLDARFSDEFDASFQLEPAVWETPEDDILVILRGRSHEELPTFTVETRKHGGQLQIRARALNEAVVSSESPWRNLSRRHSRLELEWRRSHPQATDGHLYLSVDGDLLLWLVDLDNWLLPLQVVEVARRDKVWVLDIDSATLDFDSGGVKENTEAPRERRSRPGRDG